MLVHHTTFHQVTLKKDIETKERTLIYHWFGNIDISRAAMVIMEKERCVLPAVNSNSSDAGLLNPLHQTDRLLQLLTTNVKHWTVSHSVIFHNRMKDKLISISHFCFVSFLISAFCRHGLQFLLEVQILFFKILKTFLSLFFFLHLSHLNHKLQFL